ncbi:MAG TPA: hypothetical protein VEW07_10110 [Solirubrobacterales bacterium]|nr:hypothetical protein [Solirubrobacterales bacterium]
MATEEQEARDLAYAHTLIEIAGEDVKQVYLRVTGVLGLAVIFVTQLPFRQLLGLPDWARWVLMAGLAAAVGSAALYFRYLSKLHLSRLEMAKTIRNGRPDQVPEIWCGEGTVWIRNRWAFYGGTGLLALSVILLGLSLAVLLNL